MTKVGKAVPWRLEDTGRQTANLLWSVTLITHGARLAALPWMERLSPVEWAANVELVWNVKRKKRKRGRESFIDGST